MFTLYRDIDDLAKWVLTTDLACHLRHAEAGAFASIRWLTPIHSYDDSVKVLRALDHEPFAKVEKTIAFLTGEGPFAHFPRLVNILEEIKNHLDGFFDFMAILDCIRTKIYTSSYR